MKFSAEPAAVIGAVEALLLAIIGLWIALAKPDPAVAGAVTAIVAPLIALVSAFFVRSKVTPVPNE